MKSPTRLTRVLLPGLAAILFGLVSASADIFNDIDPGDTVEDEFDFFEPLRYYTFEADEDDIVLILLYDPDDDDDFLPFVRLHGPAGLIAQDWDEDAALIELQRLRWNGDYTIEVKDLYGRVDNLDYVLSFLKTNDNNDGGDIHYNDVINGSLSPSGDMDGFRFAGQVGDRVTITVEDTQRRGEFRPIVDLLGSDRWITGSVGNDVAEVRDVVLNENEDYTIFVWGGPDDWKGGPYKLTLIEAGSIPTPTPTPIPLPRPDLRISDSDFSPASPTRVRPGQNVVLGGFVENPGQPAGPFWVEFWGSRTGGLTLDEFITDSMYIPGLGTFNTLPFEVARPAYPMSDGPYSVVIVLDRPDSVIEHDETNNREVVSGKRLLMLRPIRNVDLVVQGFNIGPNPLRSGQPISLSGTVRNVGAANTGFFWIEFWWSPPTVWPQLGAMICDSIPVTDLPAGGAIDLATYARTAYALPPGPGHALVFADRTDSVSELDETNNYVTVRDMNFESVAVEAATADAAGAPSNSPAPEQNGVADIEVVTADFSPAAPTELRPGQLFQVNCNLANRGDEPTGTFWVEFWGSRTGGLTLDAFLCDSLRIADLAPGEVRPVSLTRNLYGIPDGPYTVLISADRPGDVADLNPLNNRLPVAGKKLVTIRPLSQANIVVENFALNAPVVMQKGQVVTFSGVVRNAGAQGVAGFWIEFWASRNQQYPDLDYYFCESIFVSTLGPGQQVALSSYPRVVSPGLPSGAYSIGILADGTDSINEPDESDNYVFIPGWFVE